MGMEDYTSPDNGVDEVKELEKNKKDIELEKVEIIKEKITEIKSRVNDWRNNDEGPRFGRDKEGREIIHQFGENDAFYYDIEGNKKYIESLAGPNQEEISYEEVPYDKI